MPLFTPQNLNMDTEDGALEKETPFEDIVICSKPFFPNFWAYPPWNQHIPLGEKEKTSTQSGICWFRGGLF